MQKFKGGILVIVQEEYTINYSYRKTILEHLKDIGVEMVFEKGSLIEFEFKKLDYLYLILDGKVIQYFLDVEGRERIILILSAGDLFGEITMIQGDYDQVITKAYTFVKVCKINKSDLMRYLEENPKLYDSILLMVTTKFRILMSQLYDNAYFDVKQRLYRLLKRLSVQHKVRVKGGNKIDLKLTHEELASMIGSTRSTVTRLLKELEEEGAITRKGKYIIVLDT